MARPECPRHPGSKVLKDGFYGRIVGKQRQRWRCKPAGERRGHPFYLPVPRREREADSCDRCEHELDRFEGPRTPKQYQYSLERAIATSLVEVGKGLSYRRASEAARFDVLRGRYNPNRVMNWVEVFTPVLLDQLAPKEWPATIVVDERPFEGEGNTKLFYVMGAWGYPETGRSRLWWFSVYPDHSAVRRGGADGGWTRFFKELGGRPNRMVCDEGRGIAPAVLRAWPDSDEEGPSPEITYCHWHLKENLWNDFLAEVQGGGQMLDRMLRDLGRPREEHEEDRDLVFEGRGQLLGDEERWREFCHRARGRTDRLDAWLDRHEERVARELRERVFPKSVGAIESAFTEIGPWLDRRRKRFTNQARTSLLVKLMLLQLTGRASVPRYHKLIRENLDANPVLPPQELIRLRAGEATLGYNARA